MTYIVYKIIEPLGTSPIIAYSKTSDILENRYMPLRHFDTEVECIIYISETNSKTKLKIKT